MSAVFSFNHRGPTSRTRGSRDFGVPLTYAAWTSTHTARRGVSKAVMVYEELRAGIVSLRLRPGVRIDKGEICTRLGVSRQPLAEALARLAEERLVDVEPQKGTFVARIRLADVAGAAFVRRSVEIATVERIAPTVEKPAIDRLRRILGYQTAAVATEDIEEFYTLDVRFHATLLDQLAMSRVAEIVETSRAQLERARRLLLPTPRRNRDTLEEHEAIIAGLAGHDAAEAGAAMGRHLDRGMSELRKFADRQPELFEA